MKIVDKNYLNAQFEIIVDYFMQDKSWKRVCEIHDVVYIKYFLSSMNMKNE